MGEAVKRGLSSVSKLIHPLTAKCIPLRARSLA